MTVEDGVGGTPPRADPRRGARRRRAEGEAGRGEEEVETFEEVALGGEGGLSFLKCKSWTER